MAETLPTFAHLEGEEMPAPNLLLIGYARHGKDTVGEILRDDFHFRFTSSSWFCAQETIWDNWGCAMYDNIEEMFEDRVNHRVLWMQMISAYNTPDKARTARTMIERGFNLYVGMRREDELIQCRKEGIFKKVVWVDRSDHMKPEVGSTDLTPDMADIILDNNGTLRQLRQNVSDMLNHISLTS